MKYVVHYGPHDGAWAGEVGVEGVPSEDLALRHARAMKAVLLAARAWAKASSEATQAWRFRPLDVQFAAQSREAQSRAKLLAAQERLEKIEKMVSRG